MLNIILILILGLLVTFFAIQNSAIVTIKLGNYSFDQVPQYLVIILSLILGFLISWLLSLVDFISSWFKIFGKDRKINESKIIVTDLKNKIHELEIENVQLKERIKTAPFKGPTHQV
ncbi:MAG: hypothetical protein A3I07_04090 [Candidatus Doudnabacteria bacterium RIFCSPLOWO2_02_FULL_42_9]|uniref:Lipopolysaccharide assembly protein A domain-containing protein n=1 Tax=Candidatus Doudnabacteria bacterium RIFCSPHIGHO2_01_FULL_41_86 TaxID=1817821 RepID=A0A1F5N8L6_9BACT|nr:MAG: hypothetical protein A2717_00330 [Candidatus Doudnabacteria bacterium RIFCSPHIGHO2_01_FULL_41_86]OGE75180.1 MAG: hypothetical protein A3K07_01720 [Candidatus Doudnabacteria bacterium RIFCSPHIGHO2_01_43_10]OGE86395.1 MAG: hypothetical protein A3E28_00205 [Candidatus Doudnabacteria bacterium RIFCSPHIGHO2_12_FULL_42_22]OGE87394.1 MAG: hypothetical protein A3C49_04190 [Candidatus Doudnabacteria bacterium RIFCSPHIGHO2_02_FULL_42_25]OGE92692.1 MAG: hypothetical protein A2895_03685 [Candidatus